jgi:hypothetical protein
MVEQSGFARTEKTADDRDRYRCWKITPVAVHKVSFNETSPRQAAGS